MTMACPFLVLDMTLDRKDGLNAQAREVVYRVHPEWPQGQIVEKAMTSGFLNTILCFHLATDEELSEAVIVRVFGDLATISSDRYRETLAMQAASKAGCFGRVLALFNNGLAYRYVKGQNLVISQLEDPNIIRRCCRHLAALGHSNGITTDLWGFNGESVSFPAEDRFFPIIREWVEGTPTALNDPGSDKIFDDSFQKHGLSKEEVLAEVSHGESLISRAAIDNTLCHGDLHKENIIWDPKSDEIHLVDYEMSSMRPEGFDLAYLFHQTPVLHAISHNLFQGQPWPEISTETRDVWVRTYLDEKYKLLSANGRVGSNPPSEKDYRKLYLQVDLIEKVVDICFVGIWQVVANDMPWINVMGTMPFMKKKYFDNKDRLPDIVDEILQLKESTVSTE